MIYFTKFEYFYRILEYIHVNHIQQMVLIMINLLVTLITKKFLSESSTVRTLQL